MAGDCARSRRGDACSGGAGNDKGESENANEEFHGITLSECFGYETSPADDSLSRLGAARNARSASGDGKPRRGRLMAGDSARSRRGEARSGGTGDNEGESENANDEFHDELPLGSFRLTEDDASGHTKIVAQKL